MPGCKGAAVGWAGRVAGWPTQLSSVSPDMGRACGSWRKCFLASSLPGILYCVLWYHFSAKHAGRGGITFAESFFLYKLRV